MNPSLHGNCDGRIPASRCGDYTLGVSLEAVVDVLADGAGVLGVPRKRRDLSDIAGTWKADKTFDSVVAEHDRVDKDLWR
jgi:hypothetical protein